MLSVLMPNYNNGPYLKEALDSIFNQTYQDFVIYFVDDCSTDNSLEIARSFQDGRLIILTKEKNSGIVDTMNIALDKIETKYFIRMDGDDISTPERFEALVNFMEEHQEISVCSSDIQTFGKENKILRFERDPEMNKANLIFGHSIGHASSIFRTSVLKDNGIRYSNSFWRMEDYDLFYRMKDISIMTSMSGVYYLYRRADYNLNTKTLKKVNAVLLEFYRRLFTDMGIDSSEKILQIHLELSNRELPSFKFKEYHNHITKLLRANINSRIFPEYQLEKVLSKSMTTVCCRLIDVGKLNFYDLIIALRYDRSLVRYFIVKKMRFIWQTQEKRKRRSS